MSKYNDLHQMAMQEWAQYHRMANEADRLFDLAHKHVGSNAFNWYMKEEKTAFDLSMKHYNQYNKLIDSLYFA